MYNGRGDMSPGSSKRKQKMIVSFFKRARYDDSWPDAVRFQDNAIEKAYRKRRSCCRLSFDTIPEDIFYMICRFLNKKDIWKLGGVSTWWHFLSRSRMFWERTDIVSLNLTPMKSDVLLMKLPQYLTDLRLGISSNSKEKQVLGVPILFYTLCERFPNLNVLIIENAILMKSESEHERNTGFVFNCKIPIEKQVCKYYDVLKYNHVEVDANFHTLLTVLRKLTILSLRSTILSVDDLAPEGLYLHKRSSLKILDLTLCPSAMDGTILSFCQVPLLQEIYLAGTAITVNGVSIILNELPKLRVLDLDDTVIGSETFEVIRQNGRYLVEICLGKTGITDSDLIDIKEDTFPCLQKLCLQRTAVSKLGVKKLLLTVRSLKRVILTKSQVKITWMLDQPAHVRSKLKYDDSDVENEDCNHFLMNTFQGKF